MSRKTHNFFKHRAVIYRNKLLKYVRFSRRLLHVFKSEYWWPNPFMIRKSI